MKEKRTKVIVFGVFDKFHEGHRNFLTQAKKLGDELIIIVAKDEMVRSLKRKSPAFSLEERIRALNHEKIGDLVLGGDEIPGEWKIIHEIKPDIVALGYDQNALEKELKEKMALFPFYFQIKKLLPHKSSTHHSSLL